GRIASIVDGPIWTNLSRAAIEVWYSSFRFWTSCWTSAEGGELVGCTGGVLVGGSKGVLIGCITGVLLRRIGGVLVGCSPGMEVGRIVGDLIGCITGVFIRVGKVSGV